MFQCKRDNGVLIKPPDVNTVVMINDSLCGSICVLCVSIHNTVQTPVTTQCRASLQDKKNSI